MNVKDKGDGMVANAQRLREHLEEGTLAAKLVDTYRNSGPDERVASLQAVLEARLAEIRGEFGAKDSDAPD